jgi:hypothetical protein
MKNKKEERKRKKEGEAKRNLARKPLDRVVDHKRVYVHSPAQPPLKN